MRDDRARTRDAVGPCDSRASAALLPLVHDALRQLAARNLDREAPGQTLPGGRLSAHPGHSS
ncbi:MAG TPA: hypothetical protein VF590_19045 [Isosphaeraceae bacterium]